MKSLKGHLLASTPSLLDPNFHQTVILMIEHTDEGAAGVVLNRPTGASVSDIAEQIFDSAFEWDKPILRGGPVPGPLMAIHGVEELSDREVLPGLYSTVDADKIQRLVRERIEPSLILANYAGWGPGQLEAELDEGSWYTRPADHGHVFWADSLDDHWKAVVSSAEGKTLTDFLGLRDVPEDPSLN